MCDIKPLNQFRIVASVAVLLAVGCTREMTSRTEEAWNTHRDSSRGFQVSYPSSWRTNFWDVDGMGFGEVNSGNGLGSGAGSALFDMRLKTGEAEARRAEIMSGAFKTGWTNVSMSEGTNATGLKFLAMDVLFKTNGATGHYRYTFFSWSETNILMVMTASAGTNQKPEAVVNRLLDSIRKIPNI